MTQCAELKKCHPPPPCQSEMCRALPPPRLTRRDALEWEWQRLAGYVLLRML